MACGIQYDGYPKVLEDYSDANRISDAYKIKDGDPMLELKVRVININSASHHEILEKCQVLNEYSMFISV